ncbi:MAG TPA: thiosulfate oxidation carrier protein SoxY [Burkholderiales bacterium]|jgi:sulfur-oxidizing protein SoxY|nr:thiosulfate oxidation carrier protein SoxY [Burkholderiales bacterium]
MNPFRRKTLAALALLLVPLRALAAWNKEAFGAKSAGEALKSLGIGASADSKDILIEAPQIAENGAVVPVEITSNVPGTRSIAVVVEKNPFPLVAKFDFSESALPFVKVNVKVGESSFVRAIAEAGGKYYTASREVKVTIGGCGG